MVGLYEQAISPVPVPPTLMVSFSSIWTSRPRSHHDYAPLPKETGPTESVVSSTSEHECQDSVSGSESLRSLPLTLNAVLTLLNFALVVYAGYHIRSSPLSTSFYPIHRLTYGDIEQLRRPSQFINLEKMYTNIQPQPHTFKNWPLILAPVDSRSPHTTFSDDPKRHTTNIGQISPEDRAFHVSGTVSTIVQFRSIDFMMEFCQLKIIPPPGAVGGDSIHKLEIYQIDNASPLRPRDLTFSTRPTHSGPPIAKTQISNGSEWSYAFDCSQDQLFTFEIQCEQGSPCNLEWWQDKEHRDYGIFILQSSIKVP